MQTRSNHNGLKLTAMLVIFIVPLVLSWCLYHYHTYWQLKTSNHGTLVQPPFVATDLVSSNTHTWQILFVPAQCFNAKTDQVMFMLHQLRRVLGKNSERVSLTLGIKQGCQFGDTHDFHPLLLTNKQDTSLQTALNTTITGKIYLLDPLGNLFMYYPADTDGMNILKDLQRVLEVSQIG